MVHINQCILEDNKLVVFVDHRETSSDVVKILERLGIETKKIKLDVGDFLVSEEICIERKTADDFVRSIIDGRLFQQIKNMVENFKKPILLIEGNPKDIGTISENSIWGAIVSVTLDFNVPIFITKNQEESAKLISFLVKRERIKGKKILIRGRKKAKNLREIQQQILCAIPGVGAEISKNLLEHFGSIERIINASEIELKKVDKIGDKKARQIRYILSAKYE
ncbi:MAG: helix-hairpin-helix domain-containing protein [Candidatus Parvarchaeota archaeon]|nr:helix-hairpin-helix domain-containing protein [Candidatus Jingweiarchaeum tengchongense]MCW1297861.1 helix-hairpin-helix domain-containing protein [Candidatus Jingweiarchaeum tengchongense]MCW1299872.1 helix-hairpin-helix domain-containing protein [Candidatus Jingweiarchaeum tengchongense]MCW1304158.1 helix-hairpin-helix domain-containing protein [Candidatus Jingweiarchaeum tengchongense]MCW1305186.1 helix-hairpin-helix domain-containing protein [Candidatus Jingweiarchaeum tengchongense]